MRDCYRVNHEHSFYIVHSARPEYIGVREVECNFYAATRDSREVMFEWKAAGESDKAHA